MAELDGSGGICLVCGAPGAKHYGTTACLGCKGFFRRSILLNKVYKCIKDGRCSMSPETRNSCHYCRLRKCYHVGMKTCYLQSSRQKGRDKRQAIDMSPKGSPTPPFVLVNQLLAKAENRCVSLGSLNVLKKWSDNYMPIDVINYFVDVERQMIKLLKYICRICDEVFDERTVGLNVNMFREQCSVDLDADLVIREPGRIAPRIDVDWGASVPFDDTMLKSLWCRGAVYFFDYASFMPDIELLDPLEKNRLILSNSTRIMWLTIAYKTAKLCDSNQSLLLGLGVYYPLDEAANTDKAVFNEIARILYRDCVDSMREMRMTIAEFSIIKAIYFFSPVSNLSDRSLQIIARLREKYTSILNEYLLNDAGCNYIDAVERITRIHALLQVVEVTSNRFDKRMAHAAIVDSCGMRGKLSYDIHVRST